MAVELASVHIVPKPWGGIDLRPWHGYHDSKPAVGEIWFERTDIGAPNPALLLKLIFTSEPLSIQVHPADALARAIGLARGKCEAWYALSATADARIAVGLNHRLLRRPNGTRVRHPARGPQRAHLRLAARSVDRTPPARVAS